MAKIYLTKAPAYELNCHDKDGNWCCFRKRGQPLTIRLIKWCACAMSDKIKEKIGDCTYPKTIIFKFHHREGE